MIVSIYDPDNIISINDIISENIAIDKKNHIKILSLITLDMKKSECVIPLYITFFKKK